MSPSETYLEFPESYIYLHYFQNSYLSISTWDGPKKRQKNNKLDYFKNSYLGISICDRNVQFQFTDHRRHRRWRSVNIDDFSVFTETAHPYMHLVFDRYYVVDCSHLGWED